jgi:V/A-type H+-transporting ATPase subunit F
VRLMSRVAVLGRRDAVLGFKASGAVAFAADSPEEAKAALQEVLAGDYAILLITEDCARDLEKDLAPLYEGSKPVVTILPDTRGKSIALDLLRKRVERAVGANILFQREE